MCHLLCISYFLHRSACGEIPGNRIELLSDGNGGSPVHELPGDIERGAAGGCDVKRNPQIYLGAVSTTLTYMLQTVSQKYVDETKSAIILSLEAVFGSVFSVLILHEQFTAKMIAGCILILGAVLVSEIDLKGLCFGRRAGVEE